jgi:tetratricopeptide (TPR) repeat protein
MKQQFRLSLLVLAVVIVSGCVSTGPMARGKGIDQEPMYGGMDRQSVPELKAADEKLIADASKGFGNRERASDAFVDQGVRYYQGDNLSMGMKRFNQAWLLNPSNPNVFWGFAIVYHDEGNNCKAKEMIDRSISLNLSKPIALADGGRIYTLCGVSDKTLDEKTKTQYFTKSEDLYKKAISVSPNNDYIYGSWATAYYWRGDYARSWEMVAKARSLGFTFPGQFINLLRQKMPEPKTR